MVSWLSCRNLNKKTLQARNNGRSSRHRTDHKHVECNGKVSIIIAVKNEAKYLIESEYKGNIESDKNIEINIDKFIYMNV